MSSPKAAARRRFDRWAATYEEDWRSRSNRQRQREALGALSLRADDRFLDVGCGTGAAVRLAAGVVERSVGVDSSPAMIERARALAARLPAAEFLVGDSEQLPFEAASFTALLCSSSFHHYPAPGRALAEMARVLVPGGRLVIAEPSADLSAVRLADRLLRRLDRGHVRLYRSGELLELLRGAGFEALAAGRLPSAGYMLLSARR